LLYTGPVVAGAATGATSNIIKQALKNYSGKAAGLDVESLVFDTAAGAVAGKIPGMRIPGITKGRNSYNAIYLQITTKFRNGTIERVSLRASCKMFVGRAVKTSLVPGSAATAAASIANDRYILGE